MRESYIGEHWLEWKTKTRFYFYLILTDSVWSQSKKVLMGFYRQELNIKDLSQSSLRRKIHFIKIYTTQVMSFVQQPSFKGRPQYYFDTNYFPIHTFMHSIFFLSYFVHPWALVWFTLLLTWT